MSDHAASGPTRRSTRKKTPVIVLPVHLRLCKTCRHLYMPSMATKPAVGETTAGTIFLYSAENCPVCGCGLNYQETIDKIICDRCETPGGKIIRLQWPYVFLTCSNPKCRHRGKIIDPRSNGQK